MSLVSSESHYGTDTAIAKLEKYKKRWSHNKAKILK